MPIPIKVIFKQENLNPQLLSHSFIISIFLKNLPKAFIIGNIAACHTIGTYHAIVFLVISLRKNVDYQ